MVQPTIMNGDEDDDVRSLNGQDAALLPTLGSGDPGPGCSCLCEHLDMLHVHRGMLEPCVARGLLSEAEQCLCPSFHGVGSIQTGHICYRVGVHLDSTPLRTNACLWVSPSIVDFGVFRAVDEWKVERTPGGTIRMGESCSAPLALLIASVRENGLVLRSQEGVQMLLRWSCICQRA